MHTCVQNYEGSSKGMESKAALESCLKIREITINYRIVQKCHIAVVTLDDDSPTRAILSHSYKEQIEASLLDKWPLTEKGNRKTDSGKLPLHHPVIIFFSDLCHRIRSFWKYLCKLSCYFFSFNFTLKLKITNKLVLNLFFYLF